MRSNRIFHSSESRGKADHGWLKSRHTFSFANYHNPDRVHFGALRVLNDDIVAPGMGFGTHPHQNMEIVSIPLAGDLEHKDSMGNVQVIKNGDLQVMSAGTGITHSEFNRNRNEEVRFLQIWIIPNKQGVQPRYDQIKLDTAKRLNAFDQILSPNPNDDGVWIHQDAWFHLATLEEGKSLTYQIKKPGNGVYWFVIDGSVSVDEDILANRDGLACNDQQQFSVLGRAKRSELLVMEVPML
ncbi:MAG TPA: pirin family protein [Luteibaculaceae bacterium]|nr:pirin family protein [Luteibaculaceae bacterium]